MSFVKNLFSKPKPTSSSTSDVIKGYKIDVPVQERIVDPSYSYYYSRLDKTSPQIVGLISKNDRNSTQFELKDFHIKTEMTDVSSITVFTQRYFNGYPSPVEAKYQIPLAPYSAVSDFVVQYDDKVLRGTVKGKQDAANDFSDAIASGGQAFLGEKNDKGYFNLSIGNLPPGKEVTIAITIVSEVGLHLQDLHYCLHRYMFPKNSLSLKLDMEVDLSTDITDIQIDHYQFKKEINQNRATISLEHNGVVNKNLIVVVKPKTEEKPGYFLEYNKEDKTAALALNFYPRFQISPDEVDQKSEFVFLLDCSGSMSGGAITKAKRALEILMRSLTENSKFNIVLFGSNFKSLFPESMPYDDANLEIASTYIQKIQADLGGTELLPPIKSILSKPYDPQYPRQVFILTDGEVSERDQLIDFVGKEANTTRIFTLGIGSGVDRELVIGLSKSCKGYYEFIEENSMMETQVVKLMSIAMEPTISNIRVDWDGLQATQAPSIVRPIFNNERMIIYSLIDNLVEGETPQKTIKLTCDGPTGQELVYEVVVDFSKSGSNKQLHTLTAYEMIKDMEEKERKNLGKFKDEITKLGVKYRLVSKHTSFVVVAESDQPTLETMKQVNVIEPEVTATTSAVRPGSINLLSAISSGAKLSSRQSYSYSSASSGSEDECDFEDGEDDDDHLMSCDTQILFEAEEDCKVLQSQLMDLDCLSDTAMEIQCEAEPELRRASSSYKKGGSMLPSFSFFSGSSSPKESKEKEKDKDLKKKKLSSSPPRSRKMADTSSSSPTSTSTSSNTVFYKSSPAPAPAAPTPTPVSAPKPSSTGDLLIDLIRTQRANGSWVQGSVTLTIPTVPDVLKSVPIEVWVTLVVITTITKKFADKKSQWELVVQKASKWVKQQLARASNITQDFDSLCLLVNV
ncbi:type A von Willebrand factor domain-containing protein [Cavenderia fasciculata]|uniref:Type A von Willebrand factor domain-containing protein n=1 Tax=Cavenderia fasciculata TaxID=261658 RepID=F4QEC7_CACFS|nr:type A von Willebrand factor domain-containing protein [Cavenderia fasciculata]EGG14074.1 type A von Willebrand factor domain-containing protein [Cavenderia fasciculata]|eukprot:XP_004350782.1 type A von Willebrand factor domain-containing protein [Cavenderia fasciculata]